MIFYFNANFIIIIICLNNFVKSVDHVEKIECLAIQEKYHGATSSSSLPTNLASRWTELNCDQIIKDEEERLSIEMEKEYLAMIHNFALSSERRVISFCLFGNPKKGGFNRYYNGALDNIRLRDIYFQGWEIWMYISEEIPVKYHEDLAAMGANVIAVNKDEYMFSRFAIADDPTVDRYLMRDTDSRLNSRERIAVEEWIQSGLPLHSMRDHPWHCGGIINGGMWGGTKGAIQNISRLSESWQNLKKEYGTDNLFLTSIWVSLEDKVLAHDSYCCKIYRKSQPFPTQRLPNYQHAGQRFNGNNRPFQSDIDSGIRGKKSPRKCRKYKNWKYG